MKKIMTVLFCLLLFLSFSPAASQEPADPYLWLEEVEGAKALDWVKARNAATVAELEQYPKFRTLHQRILQVLNSRERIAYPDLCGDYVYNFWQDEAHPRGLWRRTMFSDYFKASPQWETVLDVDALCVQEGEQWAFRGVNFLYPDYDRCLIHLSRGGSDATEIREFDTLKKCFVQGGFFLPKAKSSASWIDRNTLLLNTDFGPGTLTTSGYPRIVKIWHRGTPLSGAQTIYEGRDTDMGVFCAVINKPERQYVMVSRAMSFYASQILILENGRLIKLEIPEDAQLHDIFKNRLLIELKSDWDTGGKKYRQGELISIDYDQFLMGDRQFDVLFEPGERSSLVSVATTHNFILLTKLTNIRSELFRYRLEDDRWIGEKVPAPDMGTIWVRATEDLSDHYFFEYSNYLNPTTLYYVAADGKTMEKVKSLPDFFDARKLMVDQFEAVSSDGTRIPYFLVHTRNMSFDDANPVLLYGYGGFEASMQPTYSAITGVAWLEQGGVYVVANIRGGGEFGPKWHLAALKEKRQNAYDDFISVAEDLIHRKVTSPRHLGIMGGSNGGLLVGVAFTQRPDLFNAVVCSNPLLDMKRYNKLLAGASWMGEYGDPDVTEEWEYISKYSPYQNLKADKKYPKVLFTTTTRDDRVHPGHARKMAARMMDQGQPCYFFENTEGGHGSGVTNEQRALPITLEYVYLLKMLK